MVNNDWPLIKSSKMKKSFCLLLFLILNLNLVLAKQSFSSIKIDSSDTKETKKKLFKGYLLFGLGSPYFARTKTFTEQYETVSFVWQPSVFISFELEEKRSGFELQLNHSETVNNYKIHNSNPNLYFSSGTLPSRDNTSQEIYFDVSVCLIKKFLPNKKIHPFLGLGYFKVYWEENVKGSESKTGADVELSKRVSFSATVDKKLFHNYFVNQAANNPAITSVKHFDNTFNVLLGMKIKLF